MRTTYSLAALAAVILFTLPSAEAAPKIKVNSPAQARAVLEQIDGLASEISDTAFQLNTMTADQQGAQGQIDDLNLIKGDVNTIGREIQALDAARKSLPEWQNKAIDEVAPLMHRVAVTMQKAIQTYDSNKAHLWATAYLPETARITDDANQVKAVLGSYLKLASVQQKEQQIEGRVNEATSAE